MKHEKLDNFVFSNLVTHRKFSYKNTHIFPCNKYYYYHQIVNITIIYKSMMTFFLLGAFWT